MANKNVAELLVETLAQAGVERIYGLSGDSLNGITDSIRRQEQIKWVHVRHEETAAFAAGAEAHLTGKLAVCAGSCGPGNLHLINGLYDCHRSRVPVLAICQVLGLASLTRFAGTDAILGLAFTISGPLYPFFAAYLGWLGVFLTGSDTSSNALFASLQSITAHQIGVSDVLMVAANSTGGVTGKMISPQSIAVACAAVGLVGRESELLRFTVKWSLLFLLIICVVTYLQAYYLTGMVPS